MQNYLFEYPSSEYLTKKDMFDLAITNSSKYLKSKILFEFYLNKELDNHYDFGLWQSAFYDYIIYLKKILENIEIKIKNDIIKNKKITDKLIVKKFIRQYLVEHIRYQPGGIQYLECMNRFNEMKNIKL